MNKKVDFKMGKFSYGDPEILSWESTDNKIRVGKFVSIAKGCKIILNGEHHHDWITTYPLRYLRKQWPEASKIEGHPYSKGDVIIGNDVWIGRDVTISSGVTIGDGAVIGTCALVTKDVAPYSIVGGVPAKLIMKRFSDNQIKSLLKIKWWNWPENKIRKNIMLLSSNNIDKFIDIFLSE